MRPAEPALVVLQAVAVVGVVTAAVLDPGPSPAAVPPLALLFAATAAREGAAVDRSSSTRAYLRTRLPSVLLPLWLFAAVVVPLMAFRGWVVDPYEGGTRLTWAEAWRWLLPLTAPPTSVEGFAWASTAWVGGTLALLIALTPPTSWLVRRWPARVLAVPVVVTVLVTLGVANPVGPDRDLAVQLGVYGSAWVMGLAWYQGSLRRMPVARSVLLGCALLASAGALSLSRGVAGMRDSVGDTPVVSLLAVLGVVLLSARAPLTGAWLDRHRKAGAPVRALAGRAVTLVIWVNLAIAASPAVLAATPLAAYHTPDGAGTALRYATVWVLLGVVAVLLGRAESVGAAREPSSTRRSGKHARPAQPARPAERTYRLEGNVVLDPGASPAIARVAEPPPDRRAGDVPSVSAPVDDNTSRS